MLGWPDFKIIVDRSRAAAALCAFFECARSNWMTGYNDTGTNGRQTASRQCESSCEFLNWHISPLESCTSDRRVVFWGTVDTATETIWTHFSQPDSDLSIYSLFKNLLIQSDIVVLISNVIFQVG